MEPQQNRTNGQVVMANGAAQLNGGLSTDFLTYEDDVIDTPPPQTRNCCGRRTPNSRKGAKQDQDHQERDNLLGVSQIELKDLGDSSSSACTTGEVQELASIASTASLSGLPDPLSPGLVILSGSLSKLLFSSTLFCVSTLISQVS